jgi:hypothetical protein
MNLSNRASITVPLGEHRGTRRANEGLVRGDHSCYLDELATDKLQPFRYLVNCLILLARISGLCNGLMSLWDPVNEGCVNELGENDLMRCILTIRGMLYC